VRRGHLRGLHAGAAGQERGESVFRDLVGALDELFVPLTRLEADTTDEIRNKGTITLEVRPAAMRGL
jgi:hypothetical protein